MVTEFNSLDVRPYQLMCLICRTGCEDDAPYPFPARLDEIAKAVCANPAVPLTVRCNVHSVYDYQNPGREYDTPEGKLFNDRRDLAVLQRLGLVPSGTRPAIDLFSRCYREIPECGPICGAARRTDDAAAKCSLADTGNYERGIQKGIHTLMPLRCPEDKRRSKCRSAQAVYDAKVLEIRPHHLLCMACFYNGGENFSPIEEDNLYEAVDVIQKNPQLPVKLIEGPCMICPPCSRYSAESNKCIGGNSMALRDQKKDMDTLRFLGLHYNDVLPAAELYALLFSRIHTTTQVCGNMTGVATAPEWRVCGGRDGNAGYVRSRENNMGIG